MSPKKKPKKRIKGVALYVRVDDLTAAAVAEEAASQAAVGLHRVAMSDVVRQALVAKFARETSTHSEAIARARDEADVLGLQVTALRERVRLADALSDAVTIVTAAHIDGHDMTKPMANVFNRNLAYRAVPGDVKAKKGGE